MKHLVSAGLICLCLSAAHAEDPKIPRLASPPTAAQSLPDGTKVRKTSSVKGVVHIDGSTALLKNSRNTYNTSGLSLDELKKYEGQEVSAKGVISSKNGSKLLELVAVRPVASDKAKAILAQANSTRIKP